MYQADVESKNPLSYVTSFDTITHSYVRCDTWRLSEPGIINILFTELCHDNSWSLTGMPRAWLRSASEPVLRPSS
ncbi:hypothetical protein RRG08_056177 [Elysia crispata]|uniref:Uncharacterized protein n=1 Tax=Elysia crispata TaxID=231223 RepID=A0AAE0Z266_9GAST|nr:hypothetical protein RRG08_056177 [Elysia crispata]